MAYQKAGYLAHLYTTWYRYGANPHSRRAARTPRENRKDGAAVPRHIRRGQTHGARNSAQHAGVRGLSAQR